MKVLINKQFLNELSKIPTKERSIIEQFVFREIKEYLHCYQIPDIKKLKGYKNYYRLRFGNYRLGISYRNDVFIFERALHRKDIYKYFP